MGVDAGPVIARWVSRIATVPVAGTTCAAVPEPPTQPYRPGTFQGCDHLDVDRPAEAPALPLEEQRALRALPGGRGGRSS